MKRGNLQLATLISPLDRIVSFSNLREPFPNQHQHHPNRCDRTFLIREGRNVSPLLFWLTTIECRDALFTVIHCWLHSSLMSKSAQIDRYWDSGEND